MPQLNCGRGYAPIENRQEVSLAMAEEKMHARPGGGRAMRHRADTPPRKDELETAEPMREPQEEMPDLTHMGCIQEEQPFHVPGRQKPVKK
jgi:hypothetical protein